jgi:lipoprotein-releasing system ATP-binding protein
MSALLEARNVSRTLPGPPPVTIIEDASASFGKGELVAVTGPSGSGKSSLLYLLGLLDRPSHGTVQVEGRETSTMGRRELARLRLQRFGFVFQFHFLLPEFTALDNVLIPMRKLGRLSLRAMRERATELLARLNLAEAARKYPEQLSGGMRQRVAIARARWPTTPPSSWRTSPPAISTPPTPEPCSTFSSGSRRARAGP